LHSSCITKAKALGQQRGPNWCVRMSNTHRRVVQVPKQQSTSTNSHLDRVLNQFRRTLLELYPTGCTMRPHTHALCVFMAVSARIQLTESLPVSVKYPLTPPRTPSRQILHQVYPPPPPPFSDSTRYLAGHTHSHTHTACCPLPSAGHTNTHDKGSGQWLQLCRLLQGLCQRVCTTIPCHAAQRWQPTNDRLSLYLQRQMYQQLGVLCGARRTGLLLCVGTHVLL
jgi:hypothetical protein